VFDVLIGLAAIAFLGRLALNHPGKSRTLEALSRLSWVSYGVWALLVTYIAYTSNGVFGIAIFLLAPALLRYLVVFSVLGKLR